MIDPNTLVRPDRDGVISVPLVMELAGWDAGQTGNAVGPIDLDHYLSIQTPDGFVADPVILSCDQIHGDTCKTPWDYCCEPRDNLAKHMATVQVVDDSGEAIKAPIQNVNGLDHLKTIVVSGVVHEAGDGVFVVNAESIYVKG